MKPILEIQNISKCFSINHETQPYLSLRDSLVGVFSKRNKHSKEDFWALKDVSFDIMPGDTVGIIGKNGAGKSTLLKVLSKITPPTSGRIVGRGRIASLLEVGTGFHPELTGRENVFMNGSILGMRRAEILKNFDAIVDFAGVEKFIDTPLKHYSSGMQLRLAFAVAAFLENEILIIDEVLAVGDMEFQQKCMGKMEDVSKSGRTILFVSHNMGAIVQLCKKGVLLKNGSVAASDTIHKVVDIYLNSEDKESDYDAATAGPQRTAKGVSFSKINLTDRGHTQKREFLHNESIYINITVKSEIDIQKLKVGVALLNRNKQKVFTNQHWIENVHQGLMQVSCEIPADFVTPGSYSLDFAVFNPGYESYQYISDKCAFSIIDGGTNVYWDANYGDVFATCNWKEA